MVQKLFYQESKNMVLQFTYTILQLIICLAMLHEIQKIESDSSLGSSSALMILTEKTFDAQFLLTK